MPTTRDEAQEATSEQVRWSDWLHHTTPLIHLEDLLEGIREDYHVTISPDSVHLWESQGILPRPIEDMYPPEAEAIIRGAAQLTADNTPPSEMKTALRSIASLVDQDARLFIHERLKELRVEDVRRRETWMDWIPDGWMGPANEELITRDELLQKVSDRGLDIHPRTLQGLENKGLSPRPLRRWHEGAVRALYAPWVADLVVRAYLKQNDFQSLYEAQEDIRNATKEAVLLYGMDMWGGRGIPLEFIAELQDLAQRQEKLSGKEIVLAEIRFLDAENQAVTTLRQPINRD